MIALQEYGFSGLVLITLHLPVGYILLWYLYPYTFLAIVGEWCSFSDGSFGWSVIRYPFAYLWPC